MAYSIELKNRAIALRRTGLLYSQIANILNVPKPTLHGWLKNLKLNPEEKSLVDRSLRVSQQQKVSHLVTLNRQRYEARDLVLKREAAKIVQKASLSIEYKQLLCSIFFWCEGGKDIRAGIQFINSDPILVSTFLGLFRNSFKLDEMKFRAIIHLHDYHNPATQLDFWSVVTGIPTNQFYRPYIKPHTGKQKKTNYPGCVSIRYLDRSVGKMLQLIYTEFGETHRGVR